MCVVFTKCIAFGGQKLLNRYQWRFIDKNEKLMFEEMWQRKNVSCVVSIEQCRIMLLTNPWLCLYGCWAKKTCLVCCWWCKNVHICHGWKVETSNFIVRTETLRHWNWMFYFHGKDVYTVFRWDMSLMWSSFAVASVEKLTWILCCCRCMKFLSFMWVGWSAWTHVDTFAIRKNQALVPDHGE